MAYASVEDVKARLGRFAGLLAAAGSAQHPNEDDATAILDDVSAEIDLALKARGHDPAALDATAQAGLKDLAAFGAVGRLLAGYPDDPQLDKTAEYARTVWYGAMGNPAAKYAAQVQGTIATGTFPVIAALESGQDGGTPASAGDFWSENPDYGTRGWKRAQRAAAIAGTLTASEEPGFYKGQSG